MSLKNEVLNKLGQCKGTSISGEALGEELGVSRAAIWKAVKSLREDGFNIKAATNGGYIIDSNLDLITKDGVIKEFQNIYNHNLSPDDTKFLKFMEVHNSVTSTNTVAKERAISGAINGTTIISNYQSNGRGRMGKDFFSPAHTGIYMSIILKPKWDISKSTLITTATCVSVKRAIKKCLNIDLDIKWVNDLYYKNHKVCGILTEAISNFETGEIDSIILGIGINVFMPDNDFPDDIKNLAGCLIKQEEIFDISREKIIAHILNEILSISSDLSPDNFIEEYKSNSLVLGKEITILQTNEIVKALDISNDGSLIVQDKNGVIKSLYSGEISIRLINN